MTTAGTTAPLKVVFLGGHGRSGSTLLDRLLGELPGFFSVGELRNVWRRGLWENQLCGCGTPFRECGFWATVVARALGEVDADRARELVMCKAAADRGRHIPKMLSPVRLAAYDAALRRYAGAVARVLEEVRTVSGCEVIVDASKDPSHGFLLSLIPNVEVHVVHLIRDSRAVAYSWMRKKFRPEVHWQREYMKTYSPSSTAWHWALRNLLVHLLVRRSRAYMRLRYEDFVREPAQTLEAIAAMLGRRAGSLDFLSGKTADVRAGHGIAGNPVRFDRGAVRVSADVEWRDQLHWVQHFVVTTITLPLLAYYGYLSDDVFGDVAAEMGR